jgi:hypothetical protein
MWKIMQRLGTLPKPEKDVNEEARIIKDEIQPAIAVAAEVEDQGAIDYLTSKKLDGKYIGKVIEGNDQRKIDIANLFSTEYPFFIEIRSNKNVPLAGRAPGGPDEKLFSRDATVTLIRAKEEARPFLILIGIHSKSKSDREGDPESTLIRTAQHKYIAEVIIKNLRSEFGEKAPIIVIGDSNTDVVHGHELDDIRAAGFKDFLDLGPESERIPPEQRATQFSKKFGDKQLDTAMISQSLWSFVRKTGIYHYTGRRPSDHAPYFFDLDVAELIRISLEATP